MIDPVHKLVLAGVGKKLAKTRQLGALLRVEEPGPRLPPLEQVQVVVAPLAGTQFRRVPDQGQALFLYNICVVFRPVLAFGNLLCVHASTSATDDYKYSPFPSQILTVLKFWYHSAHSFSRKNAPFKF